MMHHEYSSYDYDHQYYASSSSVDCTLSLGTPSTRSDHQRSAYSSCWDSNTSPSVPHSHQRSGRRSGDDHLLARRCANCDTTSTPLWRNGPRGPKSLCNACGIRYKKEERRASAAASTSGAAMERHLYEQHVFNNTSSWGHHQPQKMAGNYEPATGTEYRFMDDVDTRDSFLSWRLNDFTR